MAERWDIFEPTFPYFRSVESIFSQALALRSQIFRPRWVGAVNRLTSNCLTSAWQVENMEIVSGATDIS